MPSASLPEDWRVNATSVSSPGASAAPRRLRWTWLARTKPPRSRTWSQTWR